MIDWINLLMEIRECKDRNCIIPKDDWREEVAYSLCELYYIQHKTNRGYAIAKIIDFRLGSEFSKFMISHMKPLSKYEVWEALFPNEKSATSASAIDEALHLLADSKLVDRIYSGDIITVKKIVLNIKKRRAKYLDMI